MKKNYLALIFTTLLITLWVNVSFGTSFVIEQNKNSEWVANYNFLAKAKEGVTSGEVATAVGALGASVIHEYEFNDWYLVQFTSGNVDDNYDDLAALGELVAVTYDYLITPNSYTPDEVLFQASGR